MLFIKVSKRLRTTVHVNVFEMGTVRRDESKKWKNEEREKGRLYDVKIRLQTQRMHEIFMWYKRKAG